MQSDYKRARRVPALIADLAIARVAMAAAAASSPKVPSGRLGLSLRPLQPDERRESGIGAGLVVEDVSCASARAGLQLRLE